MKSPLVIRTVAVIGMIAIILGALLPMFANLPS